MTVLTNGFAVLAQHYRYLLSNFDGLHEQTLVSFTEHHFADIHS